MKNFFKSYFKVYMIVYTTFMLSALVLCLCSPKDEAPDQGKTTEPICTTTTTQGSTTTTTLTTTTTTLRTTTTTTLATSVTTYTTETVLVSQEEYQTYLPITEYERILLCNLVGREYGSDYVPIEEKAKVVAVVMNRVNSPLYPDTIYDVVTQPLQFSGYVPYDSYTGDVTESVIEAVEYYFNNSTFFSPYILYFEGDGQWNYFS